MRNLFTFSIGSATLLAISLSCGSSRPQPAAEEKIIAVTTAKVSSAGHSYVLHYSGTIEASQTIPLSFQSSGSIEKFYVETGDAVKKGQLLATVDNTDMQNICHAAQAKYEQAKDAYDRLKSVHDKGSLPEIKWVEMETNLEQAKSALELAKNNLEKCNMRAPMNGIVGRRNIEPGQSAIGSSLSPIELVRIETVFVKISVPENEISKITKGQTAEFSVSALNDNRYEGTVTNISPVADAISRTYTVKIQAKNPGFELKPGMVCDVSLTLEHSAATMLIPYKAVSKDLDGKPFVYLVNGNGKRVKKQSITTGTYHDSGIEVLNGLSLNQEIVVDGKEKLSDNSLISY